MSKPRREYALIQLLPNMLTITAICAGLTAIRFGLQGHYTLAVQLILLAAVLDGIDGRLARMMGSDSSMGAELDSLADFLNFGVAPPLVLYSWALQDMRSTGWIAVLVFAVCCVIRLARFNVMAKSEEEVTGDKAYFVGVPAPAGALLVMLPMFVSFSFSGHPKIPDLIICMNMMLVGILMISRVPTWSFKTTKVGRENVRYFLVGFVCVVAVILSFEWISLVALCLAYIAAVIWGLMRRKASA